MSKLLHDARILRSSCLAFALAIAACSPEPSNNQPPDAGGGNGDADMQVTDVPSPKDVRGDADDVTVGDADDHADVDATPPPARRVEVREWRLGGPGPGIEGRTIVRYETPFLEPLELVETDADGSAELRAVGPLHVAVEAPHARRFYTIPSVPEGTDLTISHPDYPGEDQTETVDVALDDSGTSFASGTLWVGSRRTAQSFDHAGGSEATLQVQRRNFHSDETVSVLAALVGAGATTVRVGLRRDPSDVVLDRELQSVRVAVETGVQDVSAEEVTVFGLADGARLPLGEPSTDGSVFLPMDGGALDETLFAEYELEISGGIADAVGEPSWVLRERVSAATLADMVDPNGTGVTVPLDLGEPVLFEVSEPDSELVEVIAERGGDSIGRRDTEVVTQPGGTLSSKAVVLSSSASSRVVLHGRTEQSDWFQRIDIAGSATADGAPHVRVSELGAVADLDEQRVDLDWTISSESCAEDLRVEHHTQPVSDWYAPFGASGDSAGCAAFDPDPGSDPGDGQRTIDGDTLASSTASVLTPQGDRLSADRTNESPPAEDVAHTGWVISHQLPPDTPWPVVVDAAFGALDGGVVRLLPQGDADSELRPWRARRVRPNADRSELTFRWTR